MTPTEKELRELDAWIAEHVMGWKWYCALGSAYLFPPWSFPQLKAFDVHWTEGVNDKGWTRTEPRKKPSVKSYERVSIHGSDNYISIPNYTTNPADAMAVWQKILDWAREHGYELSQKKDDQGRIHINGDHPMLARILAVAPTLELAIARFSRKVFEK